MLDFTQAVNLSVAGFTAYLLYKLAANHMRHNTTAMHELREAIHLLIEFLKHGK